MHRNLSSTKSLLRIVVIAMVAAGASACSSVPNWANPTGWFGDDSQTAQDQANTGNASTPDLAAIPDKPGKPSTPDEQKQVTDGLVADRADADYSAEALRGGTEPSAAPPAPASADATSSDALQSPAPDQTASASPPAPDASSQASSSQTSSTAGNNAQPDSGTVSAAAGTPAPVPAETSAEADATPAAATDTNSDAQLGFEPSKAPALDADVARFVPRTLLDKAAPAPAPAATSPAPATDSQPAPAPASDKQSSNASAQDNVREAAVAHRTPDASVSAGGGRLIPAAYTSDQGQHSAVVFFSSDSPKLTAKARSEIAEAAQAYAARGGQDYVRIVGHSSSRTADMPLAQHMEVIFDRSQNYANVVADELIRDGVPADKVLIEAVGDSQPIYYESMPKGEAGNRRAEIFL